MPWWVTGLPGSPARYEFQPSKSSKCSLGAAKLALENFRLMYLMLANPLEMVRHMLSEPGNNQLHELGQHQSSSLVIGCMAAILGSAKQGDLNA